MPIPDFPPEQSLFPLIPVGDPIEPTAAAVGVDWSRWIPRRTMRSGDLDQMPVLQPVEGAE